MFLHILRAFLLFFFCFCRIGNAYDQFHPKAGARLNYTSVCFSFPWVKKAASYELNLTDNETRETRSYRFPSNKYVVNDLSFGTSYTWTITAFDNQREEIYGSEKRFFSIPANEKTGKEYVRFKKITHRPGDCSGELIVLDYARLAIDRNEAIVWYLPVLPIEAENSGLRDLKMTDDGTFLAIVDSFALEIGIDGKMLWRAPNDGAVSGQGTEDYHHDLQKLPSGNYMVLGNEKQKRVFPGRTDTTSYEIGTIIEYDPAGRVVWEWHAKDFFTDDMLTRHRHEDGTIDAATHMNAFHVSGGFIYAGFRDACWILKIDKRTKRVVELYGGQPSGLPNHYGTGLFRYQHDASVLRDGSIAVINNDSIRDPGTVSSLVVFSQGGKYAKGRKRYGFAFDYDSLTNGKSQKLGNVSELQNGNLLVNMGALNRIFELTPGREIAWDIFVERFDTSRNAWHPYPQYRVSATSSLYPNEFSCKWEPGASENGNISGRLTVYNIGSETNGYRIGLRVSDSSGEHFIELKETNRLETGKTWSAQLTIPERHLARAEEAGLVIRVAGKSKKEVIPLLR